MQGSLYAPTELTFIHSFNEGNEFVENRDTSPTPNEEKKNQPLYIPKNLNGNNKIKLQIK